MKLSTLWIAALIAAGCSGGHDMTGTITMKSADWTYIVAGDPSKGCRGKNGYNDIGPGMPVTVRNARGATIGSSVTLIDPAEPLGTCSVTFTVSGVPDSDQYLVAIGNRGTLQYSEPDLVAAGWKVALTLG